MRLHNLLAAAVVAVGLASCAAPKNITYFQDLDDGDSYVEIPNPELIRIRPADKLTIIVSCQDERLTNLFNLTVPNRQGSSGTTKQDITMYNVDSEGYIDFPVLGRIKVEGLTREEVSRHIYDAITSQNLARDPVVTVNYGNQSVLVLGEVGSAGRVDIDRDRMTILDVITEAGDLNIQGLRDRVWVYREEGGYRHTYQLDLTRAQQVHNSPAYYVKQNDIVYVQPNKKQASQSTVNGNTVQSATFWMSFISFLVGIAALCF